MDQLREARRRAQMPPKGHRLDFSFSTRNSTSRSNPQTLEFLLEMWQRSWERCGITSDSEKQPYNNKAAKLKKYEKDLADYKSKVKFDGAKGLAKVAQKKVEEKRKKRRRKRRRRKKRRRN
uniref:Uncharacterized protein n=1 Tax=Myotis myotis TaxID=51298 RepID=A0A7J7Z4N7_MYOMY|nr:hypothetical protein mMyoMyo1_010463 [Myotis myotis]